MQSAFLYAKKQIQKEAAARQTSPGNLATTLAVVIHTRVKHRHLIVALQVGDGLCALSHENTRVTILGNQDTGSYSGQTLFLTSPGALRKSRLKVTIGVHDDLTSLVLLTDGISDDFYPGQKQMPAFFSEMHALIADSGDPVSAVRKWISYEKRGSHDDRTLLFTSFIKGDSSHVR